jgi:hypothetical protein
VKKIVVTKAWTRRMRSISAQSGASRATPSPATVMGAVMAMTITALQAAPRGPIWKAASIAAGKIRNGMGMLGLRKAKTVAPATRA